MQARLLKFVAQLRARGLDISPGEQLDALAALQQIRWIDRFAFREALRATLVKRPEYYPVFDAEFGAFFAAPPWPHGEGKGSLAGGGGKREGRASARRGTGEGEEGGSGGEKARPVPPRPAQAGPRLRTPSDHQRPGSAPADLEAPAGSSRRVTFHGTRPPGTERSVQELMQGDLRRLSPAEVRELRRHVRTLARRLATRTARRRKASRRGPVDLKRTMRRSLQYGGVPFTLAHRARRLTHPDLVVLCDLSGSVRQAAALMLEFLKTLHAGKGRLRVFAYTNRVAEISGELADHSGDLADLMVPAGLDPHTFSDFGGACYDLLARFPGLVGPRTAVIVIGDGRNNYGDPMVWAFEDLVRPARRVVWLVPEARERWDTADSQIGAYARHCAVMAECHTLERLLRALERV